MRRKIVITFRVNGEERDQISKLAGILQRSKSDAIRFLILKVVKILEIDPGYLDLTKFI